MDPHAVGALVLVAHNVARHVNLIVINYALIWVQSEEYNKEIIRRLAIRCR